MSSTPLRLQGLRKLADEGFNLAALLLIQERLTQQVIAVRQARGLTEHPHEQVIAEAQAALPRDAGLYRLYNDARTLINVQEVRDLEKIANDISMSAELLELAAANMEERREGMTLRAFANVQQHLAQRLAQLVEGAKALEERGVVSVTRRLGAITNPNPDTPMGRLFVKAQALMSVREGMPAARMRLAA